MTRPGESEPFDFAVPEERAGFRLHRFEVFNWGTFNAKVWSLQPQGDNTLLTGDIGSGKSTLVDAITTLLVPAQKIVYNKAAGAETRERSLKSYVLGYYKSERAETGLATRPVPLRDRNSYSVILGYFHNGGFDQHVTLAQVFWTRDGEGQPERFYVVADMPLTIAQHFADFGDDIGDLRKRLRRTPHVEVHDSFLPYGAAFRRRFGIGAEQALELFYQTVSMKSVGNLTDFVRNHMLEPFAVEDRIAALIHHFDDLHRAHEAVLKAKAQIAALQPLVADCDRYAELAAVAENLRACREWLRPWFAKLKAELLEKRLADLAQDLSRLAARVGELSERLSAQQAQRDAIKQAIADNGGDRMERLKSNIAALGEEKGRRQERANKYAQQAAALGLPPARDIETFLDNAQRLQTEHASITARQAELKDAYTDAAVAMREMKRSHDEMKSEITSLRARRSNLPSEVVAIRGRLCESLDVDEEDLPFVGELLQVRDDAVDWEGAIERVLRPFGLSLLVPDAHYSAVAAWVDQTHLRNRLVYFRVRAPQAVATSNLHPQSLVRKLLLKPDSDYYAWLETELAKRFDYACCAELDQFRRERQAITSAGQIKAGGERHEKDDRHRIDDRTRYILGWSNAAKIAAWEKKAGDLEKRMQESGGRLSEISSEQNGLAIRERHLIQLETYTDFRDIDWQPLAVEIERLEREQAQLLQASDKLRELNRQLEGAERDIAETNGMLESVKSEQAVANNKHEETTQLLAEEQLTLAAAPENARDRYFALLEAMRAEALGDKRLVIETCDKRQTDMREWLQTRIDAEEKRMGRLREKIIDAMRTYKDANKVETEEVDVAIDAADAYRKMLSRLQADDLPRFETRFKQLLNENTIREVANFQAQLNRERQAIRDRITTINRYLQAIDYSPGRYIVLLGENSPDTDVRDFQHELRACTEGALIGSEDDQYTEAKFLEVKAIVERFRGRAGTAEEDRRWTRRVTDVRNWFVFSASERWKEDHTEYEHYSDSGGKSGGQKEKLAYTVLAASLAYQFGLEWGEKRSRSFRFVVIDEAFGRGSDESTRYGLELFRRLNLQLLIVTPLQKIHVIEPYVAAVGFVHNLDGRQSLLRNMTIEEYRAEKAARSAAG